MQRQPSYSKRKPFLPRVHSRFSRRRMFYFHVLYIRISDVYFVQLLHSSIDATSTTNMDANTCILMNNQIPEIILKTSKYISDCFYVRNYTLNPEIIMNSGQFRYK